MRKAIITSCVTTLMVFAVSAAQALNPWNFDIVGLRLGMPESQVNDLLLRQGIPAGRIARSADSCAPSAGCDVTIRAPTKDGMLTISLIAADAQTDATVGRIVYVLRGHAAGEDKIIEAGVRDRFGYPDQAAPMTWCKAPSAADICQADEPFLRFLPKSLTLILQTGTAQRGATESASASQR